MTHEAIVTAIKEACINSGDVDFRGDYSGRGMYGRECVGIVASRTTCMQLIASVITELYRPALAEEDDARAAWFAGDAEEAVELLLSFSQDSMGTDVILYWDRLQYTEVESADDGETVGTGR